MKFSERIGKKSIRTILQIEEIDVDLKNRLWNCILEKYFDCLSNVENYNSQSQKMQVCDYLWKDFFKQPIDKFPKAPMSYGRSIGQFIDYLRNWFFKIEWFEIYDLLEILCRIDNGANYNLHFSNYCNIALEKEGSGYRLVDNTVIQLTSEEEIAAIEQALQNVDQWKSVKTHLNSALAFLAERTSPNYRNSIKESISAVEALCKIITNDEKATLGKALAEIESKHKIHKALKTAFSAIYGYTSDSGGIRHSLLESDSVIDLDEAKFMFISCSAFINYLISKSST